MTGFLATAQIALEGDVLLPREKVTSFYRAAAIGELLKRGLAAEGLGRQRSAIDPKISASVAKHR